MTQPCGRTCGACPLTALCHGENTDGPDPMPTEEREFHLTDTVKWGWTMPMSDEEYEQWRRLQDYVNGAHNEGSRRDG